MRRRVFGRSANRQALRLTEFGPLRRPTLILGGFHGDEPKSVHVVRLLIDVLKKVSGRVNGPHTLDAGRSGKKYLTPFTVVIVPVVNPDGYERRNRRNSHGVDLNRNFPTDDWQPGRRRSRYYGGERAASESETRALIRLIERIRPRQIITVHSISEHRFCNNFDGPGASLARLLSRCNGYPVRGSIGYPTPGSLGTWAGVERQIPTVTLELPSHHSPKRCWEDNRAALLAAVADVLSGVLPGGT